MFRSSLSSSKKKILVLGSSGYLGKKIFNYLNKKKNLKVFGQTRKKNSKYFSDFRTNKNFIKLLKKTKPNLIINTIANINIDKCELYPSIALNDNVKTAKIIDFC